MVLFARWRPRWRKLFVISAVLASLTAAGAGLNEYVKQPAARQSISRAYMLKRDIDRKEAFVKQIAEILKNGQEYKNMAESLEKQGKTEEAKRAYGEALSFFKSVNNLIPKLELEYMEKRFEILRKETAPNTIVLKPQQVTNEVGQHLNDVKNRLGELKRSIEKDIKTIEEKLGKTQ